MNRTEVVLPGIVEPEGLQVREVPLPAPAGGQALVRMEATGMSFAEQQMRLGRYYDQPAFPFVPGYDLVGVVEAVGPGADGRLVGQRVAALTKTGGWASHLVLDADDLVPVPGELDPVEAETVVVNGVTAWQMLHRKARVKAGGTILVHGANGGVGSTLVQLARIAGITVLGTAAPRHHDLLREHGAIPIDYNGDVPAEVRRLAPGGVDAVFDHLGPDSMSESWKLLAPGGVMVGYGTATSKNDTGNKNAAFLRMMPMIWTWNAMPNGRRAYFYNLWAGRTLYKGKHQRLIREDLTQVLRAMADKRITAQVAARIPLARAAEAMRLAESRTVAGKVVLVP